MTGPCMSVIPWGQDGIWVQHWQDRAYHSLGDPTSTARWDGQVVLDWGTQLEMKDQPNELQG